MDQSEDALARAERHIREGEERITRLVALIAELERDGHEDVAEAIKEVQTDLQRSLDLARDHVRRERKARGLRP